MFFSIYILCLKIHLNWHGVHHDVFCNRCVDRDNSVIMELSINVNPIHRAFPEAQFRIETWTIMNNPSTVNSIARWLNAQFVLPFHTRNLFRHAVRGHLFQLPQNTYIHIPMALCKTQDCSNSIPNTLELPQSCIKPSICCLIWSVHGYKEAITNQKVTNCVHLARLGSRPNIKTVFPGIGIRMLKIRRSWHRLIYNIGIPILVRRHLYIETAPWFSTGHLRIPILGRQNALS